MKAIISANMHSRTWSATVPAAPAIFFGRDAVTAATLKCIWHGSPAHIAILGAPGIGKSSLALSIAHDRAVVTSFQERRLFVQCDTATDSVALLQLIGLALGITECVPLKLRQTVLAILSHKPVLLILDNLETPWEQYIGRAETEELLSLLAAIDSLTLIITMRGTERPNGVQWSKPFIQPLDALDQLSARQTFLAISDVADDDLALQVLLDAVDGVPLALTLVANLAQVESCSRLATQWNIMHTAMLQRGSVTRLSSVDVSIELSLESARMQKNHNAIKLLSILALFPDGIDIADIPSFVPSLRMISQSVSILLQTALAYNTSHQRLRVLMPIQAFMLKYHRPEFATFNDVFTHVLHQIGFMCSRLGTSEAVIDDPVVQQEAKNYESILMYALKHSLNIEKAIGSLLDLVELMNRTRPVAVSSLQAGLSKAREISSKLLIARCLRSMATMLRFHNINYDFRSMLQDALQLASECDDIQEEIECLLQLSRPMHASAHVNPTEMIEYSERVVTLAHQHGMIVKEALGHRRLAFWAQLHGNVQVARTHLNHALKISTDSQDPGGQCGIIGMLADLTYLAGDLTASSSAYIEALELAIQHNLLRSLRFLSSRAGYIELLRSNIPSAIDHLKTAMKLSQSLGIVAAPQICFLVMAHLATGNTTEAVIVLELAKESHKQDNPQSTMLAHEMTGFLALSQGHIEMCNGLYEAARLSFKTVLNLFKGTHPHNAAELLFNIGETWRMQDKPETARSYYIQSAIWNLRLNGFICLLHTLSNMADIYLAEGDLSTACVLTTAILPTMTWSDMKRRIADCHFRLARIALIQGDMMETNNRLLQAEGFYARGHDMQGLGQCRELREANGL